MPHKKTNGPPYLLSAELKKLPSPKPGVCAVKLFGLPAALVPKPVTILLLIKNFKNSTPEQVIRNSLTQAQH